jgi:hypothetical protein
MKKRILLAMLLFASAGTVSAQNQCFGPDQAVNGDFQTYTGTPTAGNTWINNNLDNWQVSHGTPSTSGNLAIWMWSYNGAGEGVFMDHTFAGGQTYRLTYDVSMSSDANPSSTFLVDLTTGLTASSSTAYPSPTTQFAVSNQSWNAGAQLTITEIFTVPNGQNFDQLWFRPFLAGQPNPNQAAAVIDNITIEEEIVCPCAVNAAFEYVEGNCNFEFLNASSAGADPSNQILGYSWDFGDGETSTEENPTHNYTSPGTYNVCLTTWGASGSDCCTDMMCQTIVVTDSCAPCDYIAANAQASVTVGPGAGECMFTASGVENDFPGATGYHWDFGDGNYGSGNEVEHTYATPGNYVACLTVFYQDPQTGDCCSYEVCIDVPANNVSVDPTEIDLGSIDLYPNPSTGVFNIKIKKDKVENIEVYTLGGQLVNNLDIEKGNKVTTINAENCAAGMYMVMITSKSGDIYSKKLIIE